MLISVDLSANTGEERGIPFCGIEDSLKQRIWECQALEDLRQQIPPHIRQHLDHQPDCTRLLAWMVEGWTDVTWRQALVQPRVCKQLVQPPPPDDEMLHLFTDGGCLSPQAKI